ncbi:hypothetical protein TNCT_614211 [Trichonephila clavata]|uniref:Uncharacterized protein n=1 Tax=Trichonephila clavata TaxID=2740835 RepID=A0A8X6FHH1_TRICU|nr:hypothetical protein TNCT_614211 [Trichonephila clavata]
MRCLFVLIAGEPPNPSCNREVTCLSLVEWAKNVNGFRIRSPSHSFMRTREVGLSPSRLSTLCLRWRKVTRTQTDFAFEGMSSRDASAISRHSFWVTFPVLENVDTSKNWVNNERFKCLGKKKQVKCPALVLESFVLVFDLQVLLEKY